MRIAFCFCTIAPSSAASAALVPSLSFESSYSHLLLLQRRISAFFSSPPLWHSSLAANEIGSASAAAASAMTVLPKVEGGRGDDEIEIREGKLVVVKGDGEATLLSDVPTNVALLKQSDARGGAFLGVRSPPPLSHGDDDQNDGGSSHVFRLGTLRDVRFLCCFRFKLWWMTQRMGMSGREVPAETQFLLLESHIRSSAAAAAAAAAFPDAAATDAISAGEEAEAGVIGESHDLPQQKQRSKAVYTVFLPLLEGFFRASLQGNEEDQLELCLESGDASVGVTGGTQYSLFLHCGDDPFQVIEEAVQILEKHMQTFRCRKRKEMPGILDWFGWCTWDAFYTDVSAEGVVEGITTLKNGGTPARFVIIDDGWQSVTEDENAEPGFGGSSRTRLSDIKENFKFRKEADGDAIGLSHVVTELKEKHNVKYVYLWHAITGYWGGIRREAAEMERYDGLTAYPLLTAGVLANDPAMEMDGLTVNGLGLVHPDKLFQFYDELHGYLAEAGVDGVKVDVQTIVETLGQGMGGRVAMTRRYQQALEASVAKNLGGGGANNCIACMSHNTDGLYNGRLTPIVRASDDFYPKDPASHTIHVASVAYNSLFLGEFMQPDWDMFHSLHPAGEYHAALRAVGGCPVYVSDKPGHHDFSLLKKLVLSDGSVLRCELPGRPTRDCLFDDPTRDGKSLLKIWNLNKHTGVVGAFNCQGAGWCKVEKKNVVHDVEPPPVSGWVSAGDVNGLTTLALTDGHWSGDCAIYSHRGAHLGRLSRGSSLPVTLKVLQYEIFTISPVKKLGASGTEFAPIGLLQMLNSGGGIRALAYHSKQETVEEHVEMRIHGYGDFGAYSSARPTGCSVNGVKTEFTYEPRSGLVKVSLTGLIPDVVDESLVIFTFSG